MKLSKVTHLLPQQRGYRIDPHDGACQGLHDVVVTQMLYVPLPGMDAEWDRARYTWSASALLSCAGTKEFNSAILLALNIGAWLESIRGRDVFPELSICSECHAEVTPDKDCIYCGNWGFRPAVTA
jgi:hypothetical protein